MSAVANRSRMLRVNAILRRDLRDALAALDRARAILDGRTTAPTEAEVAAHAAASGRWLVSHEWGLGHRLTYVLDLSKTHARDLAACADRETRWWALDASGAPCAWPVVTEVTP